MNKSVLYVIIIVLAVVVVLVGYFLFKANVQAPSSNTVSSPVATNNPQVTPPSSPQTYQVIYTNDGYIPKNVGIKAGDTIVFKNQSSNGMWTASAMHPSHAVYDGTTLDQHCPDEENITFDACTSTQPGQSWSFTFTKAGEWRYHNHVQTAHFGSVVVE